MNSIQNGITQIHKNPLSCNNKIVRDCNKILLEFSRGDFLRMIFLVNSKKKQRKIVNSTIQKALYAPNFSPGNSQEKDITS